MFLQPNSAADYFITGTHITGVGRLTDIQAAAPLSADTELQITHISDNVA